MSSSPPVLLSERLILRSAAVGDVPAIMRFFTENEAHMTQWEPPRPADFLTDGFWRQQVERHRRAFDAGAALMLFMFERTEPAEIVGQISFTSIVRGPAQMCYLGYALAARAEGRGLMREGLRAALDYAFATLNLHRVMANFMPQNQRSNNVLRALGFSIEGYARDYLFVNGSWRDHVLTSLTNPAWSPD